MKNMWEHVHTYSLHVCTCCFWVTEKFTLSQKNTTTTTTKAPPSSHICPFPNSFHPGLKFFDNFSHWRRIDDIVTSQDFGSTRQNVYAGGKGLRLCWWRVSFETSKWFSGMCLFSGCSVEPCKQLQNWIFTQISPKFGQLIWVPIKKKQQNAARSGVES